MFLCTRTKQCHLVMCSCSSLCNLLTCSLLMHITVSFADVFLQMTLYQSTQLDVYSQAPQLPDLPASPVRPVSPCHIEPTTARLGKIDAAAIGLHRRQVVWCVDGRYCIILFQYYASVEKNYFGICLWHRVYDICLW